jgi:hypothetical protein
MRKQSKAFFAVTVFLAFIGTVLFLSGVGVGGQLVPPGSAFDQNGMPAPTMHSTKDIWDLWHERFLPTGFVLWDANPRFAVWDHNTPGDTSDDVVLDTLKNVMWPRDLNIAAGIKTKWVNAKSYCTDLVHGNRTDWRLPTIEELNSLRESVTYTYYPYWAAGLLRNSPFVNVQSCYIWTGSSCYYGWPDDNEGYYVNYLAWGQEYQQCIDPATWCCILPVRDAF